MKLLWAGCLALLAGCATVSTDHFYALSPTPQAPPRSGTQFATPLSVIVRVPEFADRDQLVLQNGKGLYVYEHERWAAPLAEQMAEVLGSDLERRRQDVVLARRRLSAVAMPRYTLRVEVAEIDAGLQAPVRLAVRWGLDGAGNPIVGRDQFVSSQALQDPSGLAQALNDCLGQLADRIVGQIPSPN
jgi:uncharacterized lipoprotein YmbA